MRPALYSSMILGLAGFAAPAMAQGTAPAAAPSPPNAQGQAVPATSAATPATVHRWGQRIAGRWHAGVNAPGGWTAYRRPAAGVTLPGYWMQPAYFIGNYRVYGLPAPQPGYGWSRYYDDAVLTDRYGRVIDSRQGIAWDRYDGGYDPDPVYADRRARPDNGVGGAVIGGVVGGIAGNRIAGRGNRVAGTVVGAGVGAAAGAAIDRAEDRHGHHDRPPPPPAWRDEDDRLAAGNAYDGRWVGTWYGEDGRTYSGEYRGRYEGSVPPPPSPHWGYAPPAYGQMMPGGYIAGGYYYPAPTVTTITVQPGTVTTTYVDEVVYTSPRRTWKPRPTSRCICK
jgi:Ni/Co efflux regulator RcnB